MVPCPWFTRDRRAGGGGSDARPRRAPHADLGEGALPLAAAHRAPGVGGAHRRRPATCGPTSPASGATPIPAPSRPSCGPRSSGHWAPASTSPTSTPTWAPRWRRSWAICTSRLADEHDLPVLLTGSLGAYGPGDHLAGAADDEFAPLVDAARSAGRPIFDEVRETPWSRRPDEPARSIYESMFADLPDGLTFMALHPNAPGELEAIEPATAHIRTAEYELFGGDGLGGVAGGPVLRADRHARRSADR